MGHPSKNNLSNITSSCLIVQEEIEVKIKIWYDDEWFLEWLKLARLSKDGSSNDTIYFG